MQGPQTILDRLSAMQAPPEADLEWHEADQPMLQQSGIASEAASGQEGRRYLIEYSVGSTGTGYATLFTGTARSDGTIGNDGFMFLRRAKTEDADDLKKHAALSEQHAIDNLAFGRQTVSVMQAKIETPWGRAQTATTYGEGIVSYSTAGHGGFLLTGQAQEGMPEALRIADGVYEEDQDWGRVALAYPSLFTPFDLYCAERTLRNSEPDAYEAFFGVKLEEGESVELGERAFNARHAADYVVVSALRDRDNPGMIRVNAFVGGRREAPVGPSKMFLVPESEYEKRGPYGFVIDPARHRAVGDEDTGLHAPRPSSPSP